MSAPGGRKRAITCNRLVALFIFNGVPFIDITQTVNKINLLFSM